MCEQFNDRGFCGKSVAKLPLEEMIWTSTVWTSPVFPFSTSDSCLLWAVVKSGSAAYFTIVVIFCLIWFQVCFLWPALTVCEKKYNYRFRWPGIFFFFGGRSRCAFFNLFFIEAYLLHTSTRMSYFTRVCVCVCVCLQVCQEDQSLWFESVKTCINMIMGLPRKNHHQQQQQQKTRSSKFY